MPLTTPRPATMGQATTADLDRIVDVLWWVAAEGRWVGTEIPLDREARRSRLAEVLRGDSGTIFVADAGGAGTGAGVVGDIAVTVASYGVADVGMALLDGWQGRHYRRANGELWDSILMGRQLSS